jgi:CRISPR-associated protein Cmr1
MFLGGANLHSEPELRPPAFRGILRYWTRAIAGGVIGDQNLTGLHLLETALFGSTENGSPAQIRVAQSTLQVTNTSNLTHKTDNAKKRASQAGQSFDLVVSAYRPIPAEVWNAALAVTELMITLGGVGARSRRGYGVLKIKGGINPSPVTLKEWETTIRRTTKNAIGSISKLAELLKIDTFPLPTGPCAFPCINQKGILKIGTKHFSTATDAVKDFTSHVSQVDWLGGIHPRQASPLWIHPIQAEDGFHLVFIVLASRFDNSDYLKLKAFLDEKPGKDLTISGWNVL